jgi:hypothetical protein
MLGTDLLTVVQMSLISNRLVVVLAQHPLAPAQLHEIQQLLRTETPPNRRPIRRDPLKANPPIHYPILIFTLGGCSYPID